MAGPNPRIFYHYWSLKVSTHDFLNDGYASFKQNAERRKSYNRKQRSIISLKIVRFFFYRYKAVRIESHHIPQPVLFIRNKKREI